jgi:hypothetical protein
MRLPVPGFLRGQRRSVVLLALLAFVVGNVGWPLPPADRSGGQCRVFAGRAVCCCSDKALVGNCGCANSPLKKGTVPVGRANMSRENQLSERASPLFQRAAKASRSVAPASTAKLPSCCQKRAQAAKKTAGVVVNCACGDSPAPGFLVSSLPKFYSASRVTVGIDPAARLSILPAALFAELSFAPELPPPRVIPV